MSSNLAQVFAANPTTTIGSSDILYVVKGGTTDAGISGASLNALFAPAAGSTSITTLGTIGTGVWNGTIIAPAFGGTGVNNGANTFTYAGNITFSGAFTSAFTFTANTAVTFPTSGTLATTAQIPSLPLSPANGGSGVSNTGNFTWAAAVTYSGAFASTFTFTGVTAVTFPTSGTLATTSQIVTSFNANAASTGIANNQRIVINNGATLVTATLPTSPILGDTYVIVGSSAGGWKVAQNASQQIHLGSATTTAGTGGSLASSNQYDCVTITAVTTTLFVAYAVQGNITVV